MPVTRSAKKALRVSRKKAQVNQRIRTAYKAAVKAVRENPTAENLKKATSALDRAAKKGIIHTNKAARLKSRLAKLLPSPSPKPTKNKKKKATSKAK